MLSGCCDLDSAILPVLRFRADAHRAHHTALQDPATTLWAVRGADPTLWDVHDTGYNVVSEGTGSNNWVDDGKAHNRSYLVLKPGESPPGWTAARHIAKQIDDLLCQGPKKKKGTGAASSSTTADVPAGDAEKRSRVKHLSIFG